MGVDLAVMSADTEGALPPPDEDAPDAEIGMNLESTFALNSAIGLIAAAPDMARFQELARQDPTRISELAAEFRSRAKPILGTHHLLLGFMGLEETIAGRILAKFQASADRMRSLAAEIEPEE
jgi:hypothetical protein